MPRSTFPRPPPIAIHPALLTTLPRLAAPLFPGVVWRGPAREAGGAPRFHLTFDDGPDPRGTPALLAALAAGGARATFFLLGERAARHPALARALVEAGHRVGNHGWAHTDAWRAPRAAAANLARGEAALEDLLGRPVRDVRPPYGRLTPATLRWARQGRRLVLWDLMPGDFLASATPRALAGALTGRARPGSVAVLHDGPPARHVTPAALALALPALRAGGWRFPAL